MAATIRPPAPAEPPPGCRGPLWSRARRLRRCVSGRLRGETVGAPVSGLLAGAGSPTRPPPASFLVPGVFCQELGERPGGRFGEVELVLRFRHSPVPLDVLPYAFFLFGGGDVLGRGLPDECRASLGLLA